MSCVRWKSENTVVVLKCRVNANTPQVIDHIFVYVLFAILELSSSRCVCRQNRDFALACHNERPDEV